MAREDFDDLLSCRHAKPHDGRPALCFVFGALLARKLSFAMHVLPPGFLRLRTLRGNLFRRGIAPVRFVFFEQLFGSRSARQGAVVRRKVRDVERLVGREIFFAELRRRGYSAVENAGQFIIFCNLEPVQRVA